MKRNEQATTLPIETTPSHPCIRARCNHRNCKSITVVNVYIIVSAQIHVETCVPRSKVRERKAREHSPRYCKGVEKRGSEGVRDLTETGWWILLAEAREICGETHEARCRTRVFCAPLHTKSLLCVFSFFFRLSFCTFFNSPSWEFFLLFSVNLKVTWLVTSPPETKIELKKRRK